MISNALLCISDISSFLAVSVSGQSDFLFYDTVKQSSSILDPQKNKERYELQIILWPLLTSVKHKETRVLKRGHSTRGICVCLIQPNVSCIKRQLLFSQKEWWDDHHLPTQRPCLPTVAAALNTWVVSSLPVEHEKHLWACALHGKDPPGGREGEEACLGCCSA